MLIHLSTACSFVSLLIRSSIIFIISVATDDIDTSIFRLEDTSGVAATKSVAEITGGIITTMPLTIVTDFISLNMRATGMRADIAAAAFLHAICAGTVSRAFILKAVIVVFGSSSSILVGNVLRLVAREYTNLLTNSRIHKTSSLATLCFQAKFSNIFINPCPLLSNWIAHMRRCAF